MAAAPALFTAALGGSLILPAAMNVLLSLDPAAYSKTSVLGTKRPAHGDSQTTRHKRAALSRPTAAAACSSSSAQAVATPSAVALPADAPASASPACSGSESSGTASSASGCAETVEGTAALEGSGSNSDDCCSSSDRYSGVSGDGGGGGGGGAAAADVACGAGRRRTGDLATLAKLRAAASEAAASQAQKTQQQATQQTTQAASQASENVAPYQEQAVELGKLQVHPSVRGFGLTDALRVSAFVDAMITPLGYDAGRWAAPRVSAHGAQGDYAHACYGELVTLVRKRKHEALARALARPGTTAGASNASGHTLMHCAARLGDERMVRMLIDAGADPSLSDDCGKTPLHDACWTVELNERTIILLVNHDPNLLFAVDRFAATPLDYLHHGLQRRGCHFFARRMPFWWLPGSDVEQRPRGEPTAIALASEAGRVGPDREPAAISAAAELLPAAAPAATAVHG